MRRSAKPGEAESLPIHEPFQSQGTIPYRPRAQERRLDVCKGLGDRIGVVLWDGHVLGVTAIDVSAGGAKRRAQVIAATR
jgi:hypothetical protein